MIKNSEQIVAELAALLKIFDCELRNYQTDVYIYLHDDGTASLSEFVNVGGNSWLDDDHRVLYTDKEHFENRFDTFTTVEDLCYAAGITPAYAAKALEVEPDELEWIDVRDYIKKNPYLENRLDESYLDLLDECDEYTNIAHSIMYAFEMQLEEEKEGD